MDYKRPRKQTPGLVQAHQVQTSEPYCAQSDDVTKPRPGDRNITENAAGTVPKNLSYRTRITN